MNTAPCQGVWDPGPPSQALSTAGPVTSRGVSTFLIKVSVASVVVDALPLDDGRASVRRQELSDETIL